jgi:hypothetical protein
MNADDSDLLLLLAPDLLERLEALGVTAAAVNRYGDDRVRWVLGRLEDERARRMIRDPGEWVIRELRLHWDEPPTMLQRGLTFTAPSVRPPVTTRWARETRTGRVLEVGWIDHDSIKFADGSRLPERMWGEGWEWYDERPDA